MTIAFNLLLCNVMFQKLHVVGGDIVQFFPFVHIFYILKPPLFCIHHNPKVKLLSFYQLWVLIKATPLMVLCLPSPIFNVFHFAIAYYLLKDFKHVNLLLRMGDVKITFKILTIMFCATPIILILMFPFSFEFLDFLFIF